MKLAVAFILASSALAAAVVAAHFLIPLPEGISFHTVAIAKAEVASTRVAVPVGVQPKAAVESRQAPVPLLTRERVAWTGLPVLEANATHVATGFTTPPLDEEGSRFARGAIEADGYKGVLGIARGPDGTWRARALRGRTEVLITVDREGRVSAD